MIKYNILLLAEYRGFHPCADIFYGKSYIVYNIRYIGVAYYCEIILYLDGQLEIADLL